ncbi:hypothetical protein CC86DRAFT_407367 [Ophiobolus disseminans]|uniref:Uncharacterized protein n=1 Tax=Ophiobolus disseminans TaxID=1469910 RepID=A0A6A6ZXB1_9PLEO|nr:hypothetical protein CC86DRAFT_407367 [Ophiobolus disseminans]
MLAERQSIPDQSGNTGNEPAPVAPQPPPQVAIPTQSSTIIISIASTTLAAGTIISTISPLIPSTTLSSPQTTSAVTSASSPPTLPSITSNVSSTSSSTPSPPVFNPENQLQRTTPSNPVSPATLAGIIVGSAILIALLVGTAFILHRRKKAREVAEIPIRRSKIGSRLGLRIFGSHYDDKIRSSSRGGGKFTERTVSSRGSIRRDVEKATVLNNEPVDVSKPPISPSIYSPRRLTRAARLSTMTFRSITGWLDKSTIGRPQPAFVGTPSQLLDAPQPLFARNQERVDDKAPWTGSEGRSRDISPPRPVRPLDAEPLGRLSGMGYGLGMRGR